MKAWGTVRTWGEMIKFSHSVFALPFAVIAVMLAARGRPHGLPSLPQAILILVCMVAARSFAMTFNRIADAVYDARNPRTAGRALAAGTMSRSQAVAFLFACAAVFVAACAGFWFFEANRWPVILSIPVLIYLAGYSYSKRFTFASHFVLGAAIATAPVAAWIAIEPATLGRPALLLMAAVATWIAGFDLIYACQDIAVDRREGLHSLPARFGPGAALWVSRVCHVLTVVLLALLGRVAGMGMLYWAGLVIVAVLLIVEQSLVRANDFSRVNLAFFTINGCVSLVFAAAAVADLLIR